MTRVPVIAFELVLSDTDPHRPPLPSANELYTMGYKGRRILSKKGEAFKADVMRHVADTIAGLPWPLAISTIYERRGTVEVMFEVWLPTHNASWKPGKKTEKSGLSCPYKKEDATNFVKAAEDAVSKATGIDDSANFFVGIRKHNSVHRAISIRFEVYA